MNRAQEAIRWLTNPKNELALRVLEALQRGAFEDRQLAECLNVGKRDVERMLADLEFHGLLDARYELDVGATVYRASEAGREVYEAVQRSKQTAR